MASVAILGFFSPCGYQLPQRHLANTIRWLINDGIKVVVAQVVLPDASPQYVPPIAQSLVYRSSDILFYKENLWNLAARQTDHDRIFFFDTDVVLSSRRWHEKALRSLERCDVIQPFEVATWMTRDGMVDYCRPPSAQALAVQDEPDAGKYHPGFAWGMTREAFEALGGWYDKHPAGGGDTAFAYANYWAHADHRSNCALTPGFWKCSSFSSYCKNARNARLKFGITEGISARHLWHGSWKNRGYVSRNSLFRAKTNGEYPVHYRKDGLLQWDEGSDSKAAARYFASRKEDG